MKPKQKFLGIKMEDESRREGSKMILENMAYFRPRVDLKSQYFFSSNFTLFSYYLSSLGTIKHYRMLLIFALSKRFLMPTKQKDCWKAAGILHLHPRRKGLYGIFGNIVRQRDARMGDLRFLCSQKDRRSEPIF